MKKGDRGGGDLLPVICSSQGRRRPVDDIWICFRMSCSVCELGPFVMPIVYGAIVRGTLSGLLLTVGSVRTYGDPYCMKGVDTVGSVLCLGMYPGGTVGVARLFVIVGEYLLCPGGGMCPRHLCTCACLDFWLA